MLTPPFGDRGSDDALEAQARADLAAGRWRKARDAFKELCKRNRAAFLPLLIDANVGLARSMLDKRLISDARQVLTYLKTFAPRATIVALEADLALQAVDDAKAAPDPVALLAEGALAPDDQRRIADQLVVAFNRGGMEASTSAEAEVVADLDAIQRAIEAACLGEHDRALELVRPIKRDSRFGHWRLFVRAVAAYQRGDADKAVHLFEELPANSAPGRARAAWLLALGQRSDDARGAASDAVLEAAGALSGEPGWGQVLARAESLWRAEKHIASYRAVRDGRTSFPSDGVDFSSALSEFYFNSIFTMHERHRNAYADSLVDIEGSRRAKSPMESMLIRRALCLLLTSDPDGDFAVEELQPMWVGFLQGYERAHGTNARLASVAWGWLGEVFARPRQQAPWLRQFVSARDREAAIAALEKSIALDSANVDAHLRLSSVFKSAARVRDRNRLLDLMASRFPNDKDVLLAAAAGYVDRKNHAKAVDCYERAMVLDRLDPATPDLLVSACLRLAVLHYHKGKLVAGRRALDRAEALSVHAPLDLVRGRWCLVARRGVMETMYGDASLAAASLDEARGRSPSSAAFLFYVRLAWSSLDACLPFPGPLRVELARAATSQPNAHDAALLVQSWRYWAPDGKSRRRGSGEESWLRRYLKGAARLPFARDDAACLLDLLRTLPEFDEESRSFSSRVLKQDPADPLFLLYRDTLGRFPMLTRAEYQAILDEARRRGDVAAEKLAHEVAGRISILNPPPPGPREDDHADEFDEFEDDDDVDFGSGLPPDFGESPAEMAKAAELMERIARAPDAELEELIRRRPEGVSAELLDILIAFARAGRARPPTGRAGKRPPEKPSSAPRVVVRETPPPDPLQVDLF